MKNKVIIVNPDHGARIHITDDPSLFVAQPNEVLLVNPDTKLVDHFPPELWKYQDERLMPVSEDGELSQRMKRIKLIPKMVAASAEHDLNLDAALSIIEELPLRMDRLMTVLSVIDDDLLAMGLQVAKLDHEQTERVAKTYLEIKHQRHWLVAIVVLLVFNLLYEVLK